MSKCLNVHSQGVSRRSEGREADGAQRKECHGHARWLLDDSIGGRDGNLGAEHSLGAGPM